jgi:dipeptidyl aminopeptidase/acylaminoacyl peptidase
MAAGENDHYLPRQEQLMAAFEKNRIPCKYVIIPEEGHQYPEKESEHIEQAIQYLNLL